MHNSLERRRDYYKSWRDNNREQYNAYAREWYAKNRDRILEQARLKGIYDPEYFRKIQRAKYHRRKQRDPKAFKRAQKNHSLKAKYGISLSDYENLLTSQGGHCAICHNGTSEKYLHVDHDHKTGKIRGLLCGSCNSILGYCYDKPSILLAAQAYLVSKL